MAIYKRNDTYYVNFTYQGKRHIRSTKTSNRKVALQIESQMRLDLVKQEELGVKPIITLEEGLEIILKEALKRKYKTAYPSYIKTLRSLLDTSKPIHKVSNLDLYNLQETLKDKYKPATIDFFFKIIKQVNNRCKQLGYLVNYDLKLPKRMATPQRLRILSYEQEQLLLDQLRPKDSNRQFNRFRLDNLHLVIVLLDTGCRYSEVSNLKWTDLDFENDEINLWRSKNSNESNLRMTDRVKKLFLERAKSKTGKYVFTAKDGSPRKHNNAAIKKAFIAIGLPEFTIHDLRHCCASRLIQKGLNLYQVSKILGHSDTKTTQIYAHLDEADVFKKARDILNNVQKTPEILDLSDVDTTVYPNL